MGLIRSDSLVTLLNVAHRNHSVIANNLANLNTPGFRTARLRFARELDDVLDRHGAVKAGQKIEAELHRPMFADVGADGNDVSLAREIGQLNKNAMKMLFYLEVLGARVRRLRAAIEGR